MPPKADPTVTAARLEYAQGLFDMRFIEGSARAILTMSDGKTVAFNWYHEEVTFKVRDFMGKSMDQIRDLHRKRDLKYLSSK